MNKKTRCGYVTLIGQPNVGKSTLLNRLLGRKLSITARKPQTTRHRILGIKTIDTVQILYVDTPGLHLKAKRAMNRIMNRAAIVALHDVDVIVFIVEAICWNEQDDWILKQLKKIKIPVILVVNKIDVLAKREALLEYIDRVTKKFNFRSIIPLSAKTGEQVEILENEILQYIPESVHYFPPKQLTDRGDRFIMSEIIREKLTRMLGKELPYALTVVVETFKEGEKLVKISAIIYVEKQGQKAIVIGKAGERLKLIGQKARKDIEKFFEKKVFLQLWVKVKHGWSNDERILKSLGYGE